MTTKGFNVGPNFSFDSPNYVEACTGRKADMIREKNGAKIDEHGAGVRT